MRQQMLREVINLTKVTKLDEEKPGLCFQYIIHFRIRRFHYSLNPDPAGSGHILECYSYSHSVNDFNSFLQANSCKNLVDKILCTYIFCIITPYCI